jgi:hypothetical protein
MGLNIFEVTVKPNARIACGFRCDIITESDWLMWETLCNWCYEHFGVDSRSTWFTNHWTIWICDPAQALEFKLRWV